MGSASLDTKEWTVSILNSREKKSKIREIYQSFAHPKYRMEIGQKRRGCCAGARRCCCIAMIADVIAAVIVVIFLVIYANLMGDRIFDE
jgi:isoprenylcysteine carboxyl methyltransferase (ICMT) family protein YpbQ